MCCVAGKKKGGKKKGGKKKGGKKKGSCNSDQYLLCEAALCAFHFRPKYMRSAEQVYLASFIPPVVLGRPALSQRQCLSKYSR